MIIFLVLIIELLGDIGTSKFPNTPFFTQISRDLHANPVSRRASISAIHGNSSMAVYTFLNLYLIRVYLIMFTLKTAKYFSFHRSWKTIIHLHPQSTNWIGWVLLLNLFWRLLRLIQTSSHHLTCCTSLKPLSRLQLLKLIKHLSLLESLGPWLPATWSLPVDSLILSWPGNGWIWSHWVYVPMFSGVR